MIYIKGESAWIMHRNSRNDYFLVEKAKHFHIYCPVALETTLSAKFLLDAKVKNIGFWNISNLVFFCNSVSANMTFKHKLNFWNIKIYRKFKTHWVCAELKIDIYFLRQLITAEFCEFLSTTIEVWLLDGRLMICHQFQTS